MKVAIYGGSFNPITNAHLAIAKAVIKEFKVKWFLFEPVNDVYPKYTANVEHRINMVRLGIGSINSIGDTMIDCGCIHAYNTKQMFTFQLLERYKRMFPNAELFFICGVDSMLDFKNWKRPERILELATIIEFGRSGYSADHGWDTIKFPKTSYPQVSSTQIRQMIENGEEVSWRYIPRKVYNYIQEKRLYKS